MVICALLPEKGRGSGEKKQTGKAAILMDEPVGCVRATGKKGYRHSVVLSQSPFSPGTLGRRVGFWSALLFQCLPASARILSDGLSEGVFLLLTAVALLLAVHALRSGSVACFTLCGICGGLAY